MAIIDNQGQDKCNELGSNELEGKGIGLKQTEGIDAKVATFEVAGQMMTAEQHLAFMKDMFPHNPEIIEAYQKKIATIMNEAFPFKGFTYLNVGDEIECIDLKLTGGQYPTVKIGFKLNGQYIERFLTPSSLWLAICDFHRNRVIEVKDPQPDCNTT